MKKLKKYQKGGLTAAIKIAKKISAPYKVSPILKRKMLGFEPSIRLAPNRKAYNARIRAMKKRGNPVNSEILRGPVEGDPSVMYKTTHPNKPISKRKDLSKLLDKAKPKLIKGGSLRRSRKY